MWRSWRRNELALCFVFLALLGLIRQFFYRHDSTFLDLVNNLAFRSSYSNSTASDRVVISPLLLPSTARLAPRSLAPPQPPPPTMPRVAVCISGQVRSYRRLIQENTTLFVVKQDSPPIGTPEYYFSKQWARNETIVENAIRSMLKPLLRRGPVDVFMYVQTLEREYEPKIGDTSVCDWYRVNGSDIVDSVGGFGDVYSPPSRLFCAVEKEKKFVPLYKTFWRFGKYQNGTYPQYAEQLLLQLDGLRWCNELRQRVEKESGVHYTHMIRYRPDVVFFEELPNLHLLSNHRVSIMSRRVLCCGNEDTFAVVPSPCMNCFFDRIEDLLGEPPNDSSIVAEILRTGWNAEAHAFARAKQCNCDMDERQDIVAVVGRVQGMPIIPGHTF